MLAWMARHVKQSSIVAFDIETRGVEPHLDETTIVGFSLAVGDKAAYLSLEKVDVGTPILRRLGQLGCRMIAHNLMFDGVWVAHYWPTEYKTINWWRCTYLSYKLMATEGWPNQKWGLKDAQLELLGWTDTNELELDEWLVGHGYVRGAVTKRFREELNYVERLHEYTRNNLTTKGAKKFSPSKGDMWRAPASILGKYCCLDSYSTLLLWSVLEPVELEFRALTDYLNAYMHLLKLLIKQKCNGIQINQVKLFKAADSWSHQAADALTAFMLHPEVAGSIIDYTSQQMQLHYYDKEPAKLKKDGTPSKVHANWVARHAIVHEKVKFNLNSNQQLCWLFYTKLGYAVAKRTESGAPSVDKKVVHLFGEPGQLLARYNRLEKELSYISSCIGHTDEGILHPGFRVPGTLTGRLSGSGGINLQQVPKVREYLECYEAREGTKWVQCDFSALEKVVLAELSRDPALLHLYGPDAKPNDVYLFDGAHLPGIRDSILAHGYDPYNPTPEAIRLTKKLEKGKRGEAKTVSLGVGYGMGFYKYMKDEHAKGNMISEVQARSVIKAQRDTYSGVLEYETELMRQYRKNDGWILNGIGRPIGIHADYTKDIINRTCQSTGHDILIFWVQIFSRLLDEAGIDWTPIIIDFHDESIIEVPAQLADATLEIITTKAFDELNRYLGNYIPLKGDGIICDNLAEIKIED